MSDDVLRLLREDLRDFSGYRSARSDALQALIWLNANESPWPNPADPDACLRRYPQPQPEDLRQALADLYGCRAQQLLAGRGSDECIDLLLRALCLPGRDAVLITSPTFGMYAVGARLHGATVIDVPLLDAGDRFACDFATVAAAARQHRVKLVFVCSPGNPTGSRLPLDDILALARQLRGQALVVVDEAYVEFAPGASAVAALDRHANLAVLRTLSKAHALAAARIGCVIAAPALIAALQRCQAPYPLPTPCVAAALAALSVQARATISQRIEHIRAERERLRVALEPMRGVRRVYRSDANFLLLRLDRVQQAVDALAGTGIAVRDLRHVAWLGDALRITIGTRQDNDAVLAALSSAAVAA